ncbi:MAG TPA: hypothetical protein VM901_09145 [Bdellovibrionota bacterium]|nr:hypothetical protein [Bdellovibrionota bacterium]
MASSFATSLATAAPITASEDLKAWCLHLLKNSAKFRADVAVYGDDLLKDPERPLRELRALGISGRNGNEVVQNLMGCCMSVRTVAAALGVSDSLVYKWVNPNDGNPVPPNNLFRLAQIMGDYSRLEPNEFLKKYPHLPELVQHREINREQINLMRAKEIARSKSEVLLTEHRLDNPMQLLDVLSFVEYRHPDAPASLANVPALARGDGLGTLMRGWTSRSKVPADAAMRENIESMLLLEFGAQEPKERTKLVDAYHRIRGRVANFDPQKSLRENLEVEAAAREAAWNGSHGYDLKPHDVIATFARLGFASVLTNRYNIPTNHIYSMIRRDEPRMTGLMRLDLLDFAAKWPEVSAPEMSAHFNMPLAPAEVLLRGLRALEAQDEAAMKTFILQTSQSNMGAMQTIRKEFEESEHGLFRKRQSSASAETIGEP